MRTSTLHFCCSPVMSAMRVYHEYSFSSGISGYEEVITSSVSAHLRENETFLGTHCAVVVSRWRRTENTTVVGKG